jgi:catalase
MNDSKEPDQSSHTPTAGLTTASLTMRLAAIGVVIVGIAGLFAYAGGWLTPHKLSPAAMINRFQQVNGTHPGFRRNHAEGVCIAGYFESNGRGIALSKASVFLPGRVPIIGRFSLAGGQPYVADAPLTNRGLGILCEMPDGEEWRTAMTNIPVFTVNTAQGFYDQLLAAEQSTFGPPNVDCSAVTLTDFFALILTRCRRFIAFQT